MEVRGGQVVLCSQCFKGVARVEGGEVGGFEGARPGCS